LRNPHDALVRTLTVMRHLDRLPDDALLAAVALGERDAAAVFVRRFQRRVYGLAITITGDAGLADDIAQVAFERAWRHAGTFDARRASVPTWLLTVTRNLAIDAMRVRRAVPTDPHVLRDLLPEAVGTDPQQAAVAADQLGRLGRELAALPADQRRAVLLATVSGRTANEIADLEQIPLGTAKTRIRTGLRRLRAAVSEVTP
jgi:RNA polymerase sigma factor (sigma-70 family)